MAAGRFTSLRESRGSLSTRVRTIHRAVLLGCVVFVPLYIALQLTGGSVAKLEELPELLSRVYTPILWKVPEDGVRYERFFHGPPAAGSKFVLVRVQMEARMKIGYAVVPRCFQLLDDGGMAHYPNPRSPLFVRKGDRFHLDRGDRFDEELLFEIPEGNRAERLTFERYPE